MSTWATQRKRAYIGIIVVGALIVVGIPAFVLFYKSPTCSDGIQNEGEQGIDCGGPCKALCQGDFLPPVVAWVDAQKVAPGLYNLAAYVENPNISDAATDVPYQFSVFDDQGILITQVNGVMDIPPNRNTLAFMGAVNVGQRTPARGGTQFVFTAQPVWRSSSDTLSALSISNKQYSESSTGSSLQATITNTGLSPVDNMTVYAILSDANGNELDFSKTIIDQINGGASAVAPFTWPVSFNGSVITEEILPVVAPVFN